MVLDYEKGENIYYKQINKKINIKTERRKT